MKRRRLLTILTGGFVALGPLLSTGEPNSKENAAAWAKAEAAIESHLKGIDPQLRFGEFRSDALRKYLPDYHVFVRFDRHTGGESRLFSRTCGAIPIQPNDYVPIKCLSLL